MNFDKKYKRNLISGSLITVCTLMITTSASWISIRRLLDSQSWVSHTQQVLFNLEEIISFTKDAETGQRGFLLTGDLVFLEPYVGAQDKVWTAFDKVSTLTADNPQQQQDLKSVRNLIQSRFFLLDRSVAKKKMGLPINWQNIEKGRQFMVSLRGVISKMEKREKVLLTSRTDTMEGFAAFTPWIIIFASMAGVVITIVFYIRLTTDYKQRMKMQEELVEKEKLIARKIEAVQKFAGEVSEGNYKITIKKEDLN